MNKVHVRRDDTVIVISGDDKGAKGKVIAVSPDEHKVIVEGVNVQTKHMKPRKQGEAGGVIKVEGAMHADKVALYCSCSRRPASSSSRTAQASPQPRTTSQRTRTMLRSLRPRPQRSPSFFPTLTTQSSTATMQ